MSENKEALPVLGWLIQYSLEGYARHTVIGHNSVADYRDADPGATSTELTSLPAATAALSELRAEMQQMALRSLSAEGEWIDLTGKLRAEVERLRVDAERYRLMRQNIDWTDYDKNEGYYWHNQRGEFSFKYRHDPDGKWRPTFEEVIDAARSAASGESAEG